ncbi:MAG TPA: hypothetical protein VJS45_09405 [Acidimicrobiia bacterium]|jgi:hypothetical protein|nr:hypothetical protein [Acidimicrobiia bacterium]
MSVTIGHTISGVNELAPGLSMVDDWLYVIWGIVPGTSSQPARPWGRVHPSSVATADWLNALFGFAV